jgi:hypothetical protein
MYTMYQNGGTFTGGLGFAQIDDQSYYAFSLRPDIAIGKFGVGLNINLLYDTETGQIRSEDWDESYDWARLIRYARYGQKREPFYTRVGTLDAARLGHGFIMNYFTNEASFDRRKIGLALDLDLDIAGFETVTNNMGRFEVFGARVYARPLKPFITVPLLKDLTFAMSYVADVDPDSRRDTNDGIYASGFDIELPLLRFPMFNSFAYFDIANLQNHGSGTAIGLEGNLTLIAGVADMTARLERRMLGKHFLPSYFNAFYEIERYMPLEDSTVFRKDMSLDGITEETRGVFGELVGRILNTLYLIGNYQRLDDVANSGVLHLAAEIPDAVPKIAAHAMYDRRGIDNGGDLFKLDDNSVARIGLGYKLTPYMLLYMDYIYTFKFNEEKNKYEPQERFAPQIAFVYNFNL